MSLRETLLSKMNRRYTSVVVDGETYWLQSMTPAESMDCSLAATDIKTGKYIPQQFIDMQAKQLAYSLVECENGDRLFADDEFDMLKAIDSQTFNSLYRASERLSGKGVDEAETLGKSDSVQV